MKKQKRIAYCYPSSPMAHFLNDDGQGGYYVETRIMREDDTWSMWSAEFTGDGAFPTKVSDELLSLFAECDGEAMLSEFQT